MQKRSLFASLVLLVFSMVVLAQQPPSPPQPGPAEKRLNYYGGKWHEEVDMKPGPFGPGGKGITNVSCEWFAGFHVVCHGDFSGAMGEGKELSIFSYNREDKVYLYYAVNSWGETESAKGAVDGDTWTWHGDSKMNGKVIHGRFTYKEAPPDSASMKYEIQGDDGKWNAVMEAKASRIK